MLLSPATRVGQHQKRMDVYLIVLEGQGDVSVALVDYETWEWINSPKPESAKGERAWDEFKMAPEYVQNTLMKYGDDKLIITIGSFQNDRALAASTDGAVWFQYGEYDDIQAAKEWASVNGYDIEDEFHGYIY
jgi:hypothetical protein